MTHIHFAFAKFDVAGNVEASEAWDCQAGQFAGCGGGADNLFDRLRSLTSQHVNLKAIITFGGWTWDGVNTCPIFSAMAASSTARANFASQAIQFARLVRVPRRSAVLTCWQFGFEGIEIDWEWPAVGYRSCVPADAVNFQLLVQDLRAAIDAEASQTYRCICLYVNSPLCSSGNEALELAVVLPNGPFEASSMDPATIAALVDYFNIKSYYYHGFWEPFTAVTAPRVCLHIIASRN